MQTHQQKQIEVINEIENRVKNNSVNFSLVPPTIDYDSDPRICLTSVHRPSNSLKQQIHNEIIDPLKKIVKDVYYYPLDSMHVTIKNIRVISDPPHFTSDSIEIAKQVFSEVIPGHNKFKAYFYRLLLFPNNLALIGTTEPELEKIILDLDKKLKENNLPDDKKYTNSQFFFSNMTLARFPSPSIEFIKKVEDLSLKIKFEPYTIDSVSLVTCNAVLKNLQIIGNWELS